MTDDMKARGVRVRKLEWERVAMIWLSEHCTIFAPADTFYVKQGKRVLSTHDTLEAAKAAAQADYESRILAALEISDE